MTLAVLVAALIESAPPTGLSARVAYVQDLDSGEVLYRRGGTSRHAIASISKLMAMRVVLARAPDLDATTEMLASDRENTRGGSRSRLLLGRHYTNRDLLHAALLGSDNRAVLALGRAVGLSRAAFTEAMNAEAAALGLKLHFGDPTGIDHANAGTPEAVVGLLKAAADVPLLAAIARKPTYTTTSRGPGVRRITYVNTDAFAHGDRWDVIVGKTGFNSAAGWSVAVAVKLDGRRVGVVILGSRSKVSRFGDARRVLAQVARRGGQP